ncbi:ribonuclease domain-containing protein [Corynebacterium aquilae]|uniref:Uncharacterized protein n=1 Tax=Corynebacterium aquilae DSM 44791 TaxID=1431546 RepID=A0A1L7CH42_9CORY|nr:ribonuclease domain-containing protein [Corynebacterium aquilae]APT85180.1 hypothetical protein CAQU_08975 [Corynebacterium aquilae DSM 44791]
MDQQPSGRNRGILATIGAIALAAVASYFGFNGQGTNDNVAASQTAATAPTSATRSASEPTSARSEKTPQGKTPAPEAVAKDSKAPKGMETCPLASLPPQASDVAEAIVHGGPFEHPDNDGVRFGNYEQVLPKQNRNYYREYTVDTPGLKHRGARRIVTGGGSKTDPDQWFYTSDHYETFCFIPDAEDVVK